MKSLLDPAHALSDGLVTIRAEFQLPSSFPPEVEAAAREAIARPLTGHADRTGSHFVTLDPAGSTDLDQAFAVEAIGAELLLHYAIADVAWFVDDGGALDLEAWRRGETQYLPDGRVPLYPPILSEGAASLLPDVDRPAVIFTVSILPDGAAVLKGVERAIIRSRAKLAYETVTGDDLPAGFAEIAARVMAAETRRGAARADPPEQEVAPDGQGGYALAFRARHPSEDRNAALSLATNMAVADALLAAKTGLFRVMAAPDERAVRRLRATAKAFRLDWPDDQSLADFQHDLDPMQPRASAFLMAVRRAGHGASYEPYRAGVVPWHAPMAATYTHATAPLRRLADRYVIRAALAVMAGDAVPPAVLDAFERLPPVMARADALSGRISRAVIDLAEAQLLQSRVGEVFMAVITDVDERGVRIQLCDLPVVARVDSAGEPGDAISVRLTSADPATRSIRFARG